MKYEFINNNSTKIKLIYDIPFYLKTNIYNTGLLINKTQIIYYIKRIDDTNIFLPYKSDINLKRNISKRYGIKMKYINFEKNYISVDNYKFYIIDHIYTYEQSIKILLRKYKINNILKNI